MILRCPAPKALTANNDLYQALSDCRRQTLSLVKNVSPELMKRQAHPDFSPIGWHLGHIAYTESLWVSENLVGKGGEFPQYLKLFAADGLPKAERENLPELFEILDYMRGVRSQTIQTLTSTDLLSQQRLWHWLIQHESQHAETIAMVLALHSLSSVNVSRLRHFTKEELAQNEMIAVEAGTFIQGSNSPEAIDNEMPAHPVWLNSYKIDCSPVTCKQYQTFIEAGGYYQQRWWTAEGWQWRQATQAEEPLYWSKDNVDNSAVYGVSWYEANAYARFVGKRLPTESEWAKAVREDMLGGVWEWTDTWFDAYPGFEPFPYKGYSQTYFDGEHRVLRGGSFATPEWIMRKSFRNWYHPHRREMFAGFRCAA